MAVQKLLKSIKIWQSHNHMQAASFYVPQLVKNNQSYSRI